MELDGVGDLLAVGVRCDEEACPRRDAVRDSPDVRPEHWNSQPQRLERADAQRLRVTWQAAESEVVHCPDEAEQLGALVDQPPPFDLRMALQVFWAVTDHGDA